MKLIVASNNLGKNELNLKYLGETLFKLSKNLISLALDISYDNLGIN